MKRMILCVELLLMFVMTTVVQAQPNNKMSKKVTMTQSTKPGSAKSKASKGDTANTVTLTSVVDYKAYSKNTSVGASTASKAKRSSLLIADPTIQTFNAIANGANIKISPSGVVGIPKGRYGYVNGHLTLLPNGATSIGTNTGSGSVGTGSSPGSVGTLGPGMGVNGKNPYAGMDMRGTWSRSFSELLVPDSIRILPLPRQ